MTFTTTCIDPNGFGDLGYVMLMINTEVNPSDYIQQLITRFAKIKELSRQKIITLN